MATDKFSTLYKINISLIMDNEVTSVSSSEIVSLSIIHNYDTMTHPIIRLRLYSDISLIQKITQCPNDIFIRANLDSGIYKMNDDSKSPVLVAGGDNITFQMKCYIENKNIPTSPMDKYENGIKKESDLNNDVKVPIELYCYNEDLIHKLKQKTQSIYKDMSLLTIMTDIMNRGNITPFTIDPLKNTHKYDQVLFPNLNIMQSLSFIDDRYGLYNKGAQVYDDLDKLYICDLDVNNNTTPIPIYVNSYKEDDDMSGMIKMNNKYYMSTMAHNVSVLSETDIERVLNTQNVTAINVSDFTVTTSQLKKLYAKNKSVDSNIITPDNLHKTKNEFIIDSSLARINERMTKIDVSGVGFDIGKLKVNTRYNLIFASPIRGASMDEYYRSTYICNVLTNLDSDLFIAQTTFNLCNN